MSAVVLGFDRSPGAESALRTAIDVARRYGAPLVLVHGIAPPGAVGEEAGQARAALDDLVERMTAPAVAAAEAAGVEVVVEVVDDKPAQALVAAADRHDAAVIVVGTWKDSPLRGALFGSVAHKLLQISTRPVLCVPGSGE